MVAHLSRPETFGLRSGGVERVDTHISQVFLAGNRAYKLKRAVTFPYLDFSTLEKRRAACEREVQLNRRTAPDLYRAVIAVTREPGGRLTLGGGGTPVEWLVEMSRFDQRQLLDRLATEGRLEVGTAATLGRVVARFHEFAQPRRDYGGETGIRSVVDGNLEEMIADPSGTLDPSSCHDLHATASTSIDRLAVLLDARRLHGLVRQCHGDLHLHNVYLAADVPTLFDCIEFNDALACIDVFYDLAFLLMDLLHRGLPAHANAALNAYLVGRPDYGGLALLPLFLSTRAAVRSKVSVSQAEAQPDQAASTEQRREARRYLELAQELLRPLPPRLVAVGGLSGCGKSTLAILLAPAVGPPPGAVIVRSDVVRKQMFGVELLRRLPEQAYEPEVTERVYARALHAAEAALRAGHSVVLDAVFGDERHRAAAQRLACAAGVPFTGLWLEAPYRIAARRLKARSADVSDATAAVLRRQAARDSGEISWTRLDASGRPEETLRAARGRLA
ncbi:MAG TPA: AAA family ATPase [Vicinamibacterales bacterium]|nr:AAA family ATPase [Vicinamibacterales bacterium]